MSHATDIRILVSGGGTGGHVYPAIAIADALRAERPGAQILFVGATGRMEMNAVPAAGYDIVGLPISGFQRSMSPRNLAFPFRLVWSMLRALVIVWRFTPHAAIGTGGYASGPTLKAAQWRGVPTFVQEQNSVPGVTNRLLARAARRIFTAFDGMERFFGAERTVCTGNPLRSAIDLSTVNRAEAVRSFGLDPDHPVVFVTGGSLGARTLNEATSAALDAWRSAGVQVIWQCGSIDLDTHAAFGGDGVHVAAFIDGMERAYAAADVIVARAGASTISELELVGRPAILVPSPNVAEDHQTKNARALIEEGAALLIADDRAVDDLGATVLDLLDDRAKRERLSTALRARARPHAARDIARTILETIEPIAA